MSETLTPISPSLPLAKLHLPPEPGLFPLALGWWLVILVILLCIGFGAYFVYQRKKHRQAQKAALKALKDCQSIAQINQLLKRAALSYYPRSRVASLSAAGWLEFLDKQLPKEKQGFVNMETQWQMACFSQQKVDAQSLAKAQKLAAIWLNKAIPAAKRKNREPLHV